MRVWDVSVQSQKMKEAMKEHKGSTTKIFHEQLFNQTIIVQELLLVLK